MTSNNDNRTFGDKLLGKLSKLTDEFTDAAAQYMYIKGYKEIFTLEECLAFYKECKGKNSDVAGFIISVKKNYDPQSENDKLIIIQAMLDKNNKPIETEDADTLSRIVHTRTIDNQLVSLMNGAETKIVTDKQ